jgi:hypothetical protein
MPGLCPECAQWIYGKPNCSHEYVVGVGRRYCRLCGWDGSRSEYVRQLIQGDEADWIEVVPDSGLAEAEGKFALWCREHGIEPSKLRREDVKQEVGRGAEGGSFARYWIRTSAIRERK